MLLVELLGVEMAEMLKGAMLNQLGKVLLFSVLSVMESSLWWGPPYHLPSVCYQRVSHHPELLLLPLLALPLWHPTSVSFLIPSVFLAAVIVNGRVLFDHM